MQPSRPPRSVAELRFFPVIGLALVWVCLACSGLYPSVDLREVDRRVAVEAGYTVPIEADGVFVRDRATQDARTTWFRYTLTPSAFTSLREELLEDDTVIRVSDAALPEDWPDFSTLDFETPDWWTPEGEIYRRELQANANIVPVTSGRMWGLGEEGAVYVWVWSLEGWSFQPDQPVLGDPEEQ